MDYLLSAVLCILTRKDVGGVRSQVELYLQVLRHEGDVAGIQVGVAAEADYQRHQRRVQEQFLQTQEHI